ncbi:beta subunit of N-acylethanolamine-hydrolyzing acid amidase-domain-containing protein [Dendryphion nanum]|uniref:ceramidase n=1 Tax=Dendryphion nanum TaxID=256645 RepID=A0A9P9EDA3_9PLEO|nr:beta subunit of N-acylethanolamine-hydrolyzing acid amidase-domain-containing protein [Dendryphion nanum]
MVQRTGFALLRSMASTDQPHATQRSSHTSLHSHSSFPTLAETDSRSIPCSSASFKELIPTHTINLSLPPAQRYLKVVEDYKGVLQDLPLICNNLIEAYHLSNISRLIDLLARVTLRKLHNEEETEELKGISKASGTPMRYLIFMNILLDFCMGCTSGGIATKVDGETKASMLHFRTLDWEVPELRRAIVMLEFVENSDGPVIARSTTYAGFVGVLTGVRRGLSVSLNARPYHKNTKFYGHLLLVLLGLRPNIASLLRTFVVPRTQTGTNGDITVILPTRNLSDITKEFPAIPTTSAYLVLCDGKETVVLEKDRTTAKQLRSSCFIAATNHDALDDDNVPKNPFCRNSKARKRCLADRWRRKCEEMKNPHREANWDEEQGFVTLRELEEWIRASPTTNELTHFATIMDPDQGDIKWMRRYDVGEAIASWTDEDEV